MDSERLRAKKVLIVTIVVFLLVASVLYYQEYVGSGRGLLSEKEKAMVIESLGNTMMTDAEKGEVELPDNTLTKDEKAAAIYLLNK